MREDTAVRRRPGFTLVELLVAMALILFIMVILTEAFSAGLETFRRIRGQDARIPIIFITGHGTTETAIEAMKLGAYDYLLKENILEESETQSGS